MRSKFGWALMVLMASACAEPPDDQRTDTVDPATAGRDMPEAALAQLDSGNVAYRAGAYEQALRHYALVTDLAPDQATGWFGLYMAHHALGNLAVADSALARARALAPGASLIRDTLDDGGGGAP